MTINIVYASSIKCAKIITSSMEDIIEFDGCIHHDDKSQIVEFTNEVYDILSELDPHNDCYIDDNGMMWFEGTDYPVDQLP